MTSSGFPPKKEFRCHSTRYTYIILEYKELQGILLLAQQCLSYGESSKRMKGYRLELFDCQPFGFWLVGSFVRWFVGG
jgi:hypothetical protein